MEPVIAKLLSNRVNPCPRCKKKGASCKILPDGRVFTVFCDHCHYEGPVRRVIENAIEAWNEVN